MKFTIEKEIGGWMRYPEDLSPECSYSPIWFLVGIVGTLALLIILAL